MSDPNAAADIDPFDQLNPDKSGKMLPLQASAAAPASEPDPFLKYRSPQVVGAEPETSATGAFIHHAMETALPAAGSLPAAGFGAEVGAAVGKAAGPFGALAGGLLGGTAGFLGTNYLLSTAQDYGLKILPDTWRDALGQSESRRQKEEAEHPIASFMGGLAPYALTMRPGAIGKAILPENATTLQRIWNNPITQRLFPATLVGGMELGQEKVEGQPADWQKIGIATAFGMIFNKPTQLGKHLTEVGARPGRVLTGAPEPTVAQAADAKVMGPGVTEQVFQGQHEQNPSSAMANAENARQEQAVIGEPEAPNVRTAARANSPEAFDLWDDLHQREATLRDWIAENPEAEAAKTHLAATQKEIAELSPEIQAAYRRTAEALGAPTIEPGRFPNMAAMIAAQGEEAAPAARATMPEAPAAATEPAPIPQPTLQPRPIEEQRAFIRNDVAEKLIAAGRPPAEAQAAGALWAARYETRAKRFNGALGTAEDLYRQAADIRGQNVGTAPPPPPPEAAPAPAEPQTPLAPKGPRGAAATPEEKLSLLQFLAKRGGIRKDDPLIADLRGSIGHDNKLIPGLGPLIRPYQELSTAARAGGKYPAMYLDRAREAAIEAGYLPPEAGINELLEAADRELRGEKQYRTGYRPEARELEPDEAEYWKAQSEGREYEPEALPEPAENLYFQRKRARDLIAEREAEGQLGLPGTEREGFHNEGLSYLLGGKSEVGVIGKERGTVKSDGVSKLTVEGSTEGYEAHRLVFAHDGKIIGAMQITKTPAGRYQVANTFVDPRYRRQGIATELNDVAEKDFGILERSTGPSAAGQAFRGSLKAEQQKPMDIGLFGTEKDQKELFQSAQGKIAIREGARPIITLMRTADASTFIHETGHLWLEEMMRDASHEAAPEDLKTDAATVQKWFGVATPEDIQTRHHEKFARGFEQYMREGIAPSPQLASVFAKFRDWLLRIYQSLRGLGPEITPEIRGVFDRLLESEPQRTVIAPDLERRPTLQDIHESDAALTEPHEAEPVMDRTLAERDRALAEAPPEIANEIAQAWEAQIEQARAAEGGTEPAAEGGTGTSRRGEVEPDRGLSGIEPPGGAVRPEHGAVEPSGGDAGKQGTDVSGRQPGSAGSEPQPNLGDKPLAPGNVTVFGPAESPFLDKAGNIRLDTLTSAEDVRAAIRAAAEANNDFVGERRGVVTDGQVMDLANDIGKPGAEKLVKEWVTGRAYNAEEVMALRLLLRSAATEVSVASQKVKAPNATDQDVVAYAMAMERLTMVQKTVAGATAESGRALRAFRNIREEEAQLDQMLREATGKTLFQMRREAKLAAALDTPQKVAKFGQDSQTSTFPRMVLEYWINGLISGLSTHVTYTIGNNILALQKLGPETAAASAVGAIRKAMGREGDTVRLGEVAAGLKGIKQGLGPAWKASIDALRSGATTALPGENVQNVLPFQPGAEFATPGMTDEAAKVSDAIGSAFGMFRGIWDGFIGGGGLLAAGGVEGAPLIGARYSHLGAVPDIEIKGVTALPVGTIVRLPSRAIASIHSYFRVMNYSIEKAQIAYRMAANEGLTGNAFDARVADLRQNPTAAMMEAAHHQANELTLMGQGGAFTQKLAELTNTPIFGVPIFKFVDPFVKISSNIIEQSLIERTPLGILSPEIRADLSGKNGNVAQDMATARMLVGSAYALAIGGLAAEGYVSGSGPSDPRQAAIWRLAGNQAHSVRIGDIWYDVHRLGPMGMLMGVAADMYDVAHMAHEGELLNAASTLQHAITQNILDESFMRGPSDLIKAVDDPGRYGEAYIRNTLSSFVPYSVGIAQLARATDPYSRQARSVVDAIKAKIPGLSESLYPRRDIWGEPMPNKDALVAAGVTAIYEQRMSRDPVNLALLNLGIHPAAVERKIRNVDLTDDQYDDFQRIAGRVTKMRLDAIVRSPDFQSWPNHIRRDVISETITQSREVARGLMMAKYPQIVRDATKARLDKLTED